MKALFQYLKASASSSRGLSRRVFEVNSQSAKYKKFTVTPVIKRTQKILKLQESPQIAKPFRITLLALLFAVPQVPLDGVTSRGKVLAQAQSSCPAGTTPTTLEWNPTNNRAGIESQTLSVNGISATLNFTETILGQVIDADETLISSDVYGGLPGPNLRFNIGLGDNALNASFDGPAPIGSSGTLTINFSQPVTLASPLTLLDVDRSGERDTRIVDGNSVNFLYQDRITVAAFNGNSSVGVSLAANSPGNVRITGNVAEGINENALTTESFGNVTVTPSGAVSRIQIVYQPGTEFGAPLQDETIGLAQIQICVPTGTGTIGDTVYNDTNGNGRQDPGEPGIGGRTINLTGAGPDGQFGSADDITRTATTDNNGRYSIPNLPAGNYRVSVANSPEGFSPSQTPPTTVTLAAGQNLDTVDFGFTQQQLGSIGDTVYNDTNGNGRQDAGEPELPNLTVTLTGAGPDGNFGTADDITRTATTDNNGRYNIPNLPAGNYRASVANPPNGFSPSQTPLTTVTLTAGQNLDTVDFGFTQQQLGSIGDTVFNDRNGNNVQDPGEQGIRGVTVTLTGAGPDGEFGTADDINREPITTGNNGNYNFPNLPAGIYRVAVANTPADFSPTLTQPNPITLAAGQNINTADFGFNAPVLGAGETSLRLVKRITNVRRNGQPISGTDFTTFDDGPGDDDNQVNQSQPVNGVRDLQTPVQSGDEVEYTLYFLAQGVNNVRFCDLIPAGTSYSPNSLSVTGVANQARVLSPLAPLEDFTNICSNNNTNGAVILGPTDVPGTNSGLIRFRVRVN